MTVVSFTQVATNDLAVIKNALALKSGKRVALKYANRFYDLFERLTEHPSSCPARPRLGYGVRMGVVAPYLVFYHYDNHEKLVTVMRVVHGKRRITRKMILSDS